MREIAGYGAPDETWTRFDRYEIKDGYIRPAPGATLTRYYPWRAHLAARTEPGKTAVEAPYRSLLALLQDLRLRPVANARSSELMPESEASVLHWCSTYGLLGLLLHQTQMVVLAPRFGEDPYPLLVAAAGASPRHRLQPTSIRYSRTIRGWKQTYTTAPNSQLVSSRHVKPTPGDLLDPEEISEDWKRRGWDQSWALVKVPPSSEWAREPLNLTWARYFPNISVDDRDAFEYPPPLSDEFWRMYAEPVDEFLQNAAELKRTLGALHELRPGDSTKRTSPADDAIATTRAVEMLDLLLDPVRPCLHFGEDGAPELQWASGSLLATFSAMALQDLTSGGRLVVCRNEKCERLFVADTYQARYCSKRCRYAVQQRTYRRNRKLKAMKGRPKTLRPAPQAKPRKRNSERDKPRNGRRERDRKGPRR